MDTSIEVGDIFRLFGPAYLAENGQRLPLCNRSQFLVNNLSNRSIASI